MNYGRLTTVASILALSISAGCKHDDSTSEQTDDNGLATGAVPAFTVNSPNTDFRVTEIETLIRFTVDLAQAYSKDLTVAYLVSSANQKAQLSSDYQLRNQDNNEASSSITLLAGQTSVPITVHIIDDKIDEGDETFTLTVMVDGDRKTVKEIPVTIVDDDPLPTVQIKSVNGPLITIKESLGVVPIEIELPISLSEKDIHIPVSFIPDAITPATPDLDFVTVDEIIIPGAVDAEQTTTSIIYNLLLRDDAITENNESFIFSLGNPLDGRATLGAGGYISLSITIEDDDVNGFLNDTGITSCADATNFSAACPATGFPQQDGESIKVANIERLNSGGANTDAAPAETVCIHDITTGLVWEVKTALGASATNLREYNYQYTWFNELSNANGGDTGNEGGTQDCSSSLSRCNTAQYIAELNNQLLCGTDNWRLPRLNELVSLLNFGPIPGDSTVIIDKTLFPYTEAGYYWTATPAAGFSQSAWAVFMGKTPTNTPNELSTIRLKTEKGYIRGVANKSNQ